ncbi:MAG: bifunctional precorrin-2 dehydrogenase/sirohydrochlorin ferrochelatase [bacterium]
MLSDSYRFEGKNVLVVGEEKVALQKIEGLLPTGAAVTVLSLAFVPEVRELALSGRLSLVERGYRPGDLQGYALAFGATNDESVNRQIHREAMEKGIWFNAVDQPKECDFIVPARVSRGDLLVSISTGGQAPFLSKILREKLEQLFGPEYEELIAFLGRLRAEFTRRNQKGELVPFYQKWGEGLLEAFREKDEARVFQILQDAFGKDFSL